MTEDRVELFEMGSVRVSVYLPGFVSELRPYDLVNLDEPEVWIHLGKNPEQILVCQREHLEDLALAAVAAEVVIRIRTGVTDPIDGAKELQRIGVLHDL